MNGEKRGRDGNCPEQEHRDLVLHSKRLVECSRCAMNDIRPAKRVRFSGKGFPVTGTIKTRIHERPMAETSSSCRA